MTSSFSHQGGIARPYLSGCVGGFHTTFEDVARLTMLPMFGEPIPWGGPGSGR